MPKHTPRWLDGPRSLVFFVVTLCAVPPTVAEDEAESPPLAIVGGTILTQSEAGVVEGTVLIRDGKIEAVGPADKVEIPAGAERIDVTGLTLTPGLIDARSVLWLDPAARNDGAEDGSLDVRDAVDPYAEDWPEVVRSGVTAVAVQPANSGLFGGRGALLRAGPEGPVEDLVIAPDAYVQAALGVDPGSVNSILRYQQFERIKRTLESVKRYKEEWEKYEEARKKYDEEQAKKKDGDKEKKDGEAKDDEPAEKEDDGSAEKDGEEKGNEVKDEKKEGEGDEPKPDQKGDEEKDDAKPEDEKAESKDDEKEDEGESKPPEPPDRDLVKEVLIGLLKGEIPLRIEAHREDDLRNAYVLAKEFELDLIVEGLSDVRSAREELVKRRTPMVLGPIVESGSTPTYRQDRDRSYPAGLLAEDSLWALGTYGDRPADSATLRAQAALAVARGVPGDRVLRALTAGAAEVLGVEETIGTIAEGRRADLVAFAGDPLDPSAPVRLVVIGGEVVYKDADLGALEASSGPIETDGLDLPGRLPKRFVLKTERLLKADGTFGPGALRIADGTIVAIGDEVEPADDEVVIDAGRAVVTPGLVTAHGTLGLARQMAEEAGSDGSYLRAVDAYDPTADAVRSLLRGGVTRIGLAPGPLSTIGPAVGAVRLGARRPVLDADLGVAFALTPAARNPERYPASLPGQVDLIGSFLGLEPLDGRSTTEGLRQRTYYLADPALDRLDASRHRRAEQLRSGDAVAVFEVTAPAEVDAALALIDRGGLRAALVGPGAIEESVSDWQPFADRGLTLVLTPAPPGPIAARRLEAAIAAAKAGIPVLFAADDAEQLRALAASAVAAGLPRAEALSSLTAGLARLRSGNPAEPWAADAPADLVIWDGSPLDLRSRPLRVIVDGRIVP